MIKRKLNYAILFKNYFPIKDLNKNSAKLSNIEQFQVMIVAMNILL